MKSLFYGGAVAAVSGLLMGAAFKAPISAADFEQAPDVVIASDSFEGSYASAPPPTPAVFQATPPVDFTAAYASASAVEDEATLQPATFEDDDAADFAGLRGSEELQPPAQPATVMLERSEPIAEAPAQIVETRQGFGLVGEPEILPAA